MPKHRRPTPGPRAPPRRRPPMRKQSKRGAYKKSVKNQMVLRRAPIVETKQRVQGDIDSLNGLHPDNDVHVEQSNCLNWRTISLASAFTLLPLTVYTRNSHGLQDYQMIGDSLFSKYLNVRTQFRWPDGQQMIEDPQYTGSGPAPDVRNMMIEHTCKVYLICGWITEPPNFPITALSSKTPAADVTEAIISQYITENLYPYFDDDQDKLLFRPKQTSNIKIDKYVRVSPSIDTQIGTMAVPRGRDVGGTRRAHGSIPDVSRNWSTKTNRKLTHTLGLPIENPEPTASVPKPDQQNYFTNNSWIPFCMIYNPQYQETKDAIAAWKEDSPDDEDVASNFMYRYNVAHYYTDG